MWSTYGSWLPGDARGFRSKHHRIHVDGDYKNPPPEGEFDRLHVHARKLLVKPAVRIAPHLRAVVGETCLERFAKETATLAAVSIGAEHVHVAFEWTPDDVRPMIGRVKKVSSHRVRGDIPGRLWGAKCHIIRVRGDAHWRSVIRYIRDHARNSWVWIADDRGA